MSARLLQKLKEGIVVFDVDGVLAAYEFGDYGHYAPVWEEAFRSVDDNPYCSVRPLPLLQQFVAAMNPDNVYVCSVASDFEKEAKAAFVTTHYQILPQHIFFVSDKSQKLEVLRQIREMRGDRQSIAIVDDTVKTLDAIYEQDSFLTVHISSFFD